MKQEDFSGLYWQRTPQRRAEAKKRRKQGQRKARAIRLQCESWLAHVGTLYCSFTEEVLRERKYQFPFMWEQWRVDGSTIIADNQGKPKRPFVAHPELLDRLAVVPIKEGDLVFKSWALPLGNGRRLSRRACIIYRITEIHENTKVMQVINVGLDVDGKNWWKTEIDAAVLKTAYVAFGRANYRPSQPFALMAN